MAFFLLVPSTNPNGFRFSLNCWSWSEELLSKRDRRLNIAWRYSSTLSPVLCRLSLNSRSRSKFDRCVWNLCCSACFIFGQSAGPAERTCIQYQSLACPSTKQWKSCSTSPQLTWYNFYPIFSDVPFRDAVPLLLALKIVASYLQANARKIVVVDDFPDSHVAVAPILVGLWLL
ncbi:uncharacterized protein LOC124461279 isoform X2 [Drosophila willistoni]|uniref:uncharacterized protein LOC124461279 isoform X2 n=1 Tax=Drosophila willistoni TaxID=7260 RepID=UPI001F087514|nr:uncharacterized protein LOC124461279 isoform X2 [Drosophila willistoni]